MLEPQWRVTVNSRCKRACSYCRPSGEAVATAMDAELAPDDLLRVAHAVRARGLTSVKLTGGDPALYGPLVEVVRRLRDEAGFTEIEVISRHPRIGDLAEDLARAGVTLFNVSLDTLDPELHHEICNVDDHGEVVAAIMVAQYTSATIVRPDGRSLHLRSPSRRTMSIVTVSTSAWGRSSAAGYVINGAPRQPR